MATLKAELSKYLELAQRGEQVIVTSHGEEIAKIGPVQIVNAAPVDWKNFFAQHAPIVPVKKGLSAARLLRQIRDEE